MTALYLDRGANRGSFINPGDSSRNISFPQKVCALVREMEFFTLSFEANNCVVALLRAIVQTIYLNSYFVNLRA